MITTTIIAALLLQAPRPAVDTSWADRLIASERCHVPGQGVFPGNPADPSTLLICTYNATTMTWTWVLIDDIDGGVWKPGAQPGQWVPALKSDLPASLQGRAK